MGRDTKSAGIVPSPLPGGSLFSLLMWTLLSVMLVCAEAVTPVTDTVIVAERTLKLEDSPFEVLDDVLVERDGQLTIEAGVTLRFAPGVGLTVKGTLVAKGDEEKRIVFTKREDAWFSERSNQVPLWPAVRLVDGMSVVEGRLQIFYRNQWRSVCTNSRNWTIADAQVVCRQLGFSGGNFSRWFERSNDSSQFMLEKPNCTGDERRIDACQNWHERKLGSGVCDYHMDIGLECDPTFPEDAAVEHWRGITFLDAKSLQQQPFSQIQKQVSASVLQNVTISYAGRDRWGNATAALQIYGVPPHMRDIEVRRSAYHGLNATGLLNGMTIEGGVFAENRGYGIFVNASSARVNLTSVLVENNGADGIRYVYHDPIRYAIKDKFDLSPVLGFQQQYPLYVELYQNSSYGKRVCKHYKIVHFVEHELTARFWNLESSVLPDRPASQVRIYNGETEDDFYLLGSFDIRNNTIPQTVSSPEKNLNICLYPQSQQRLAFTLEIIAEIGRAYDLNVTHCNVSSNNGRGIWVQNMRTGISVNWTRIEENDRVAGLHVDGGVGDIFINNTVIANNVGDGLNASYSGGLKLIDCSTFENNTARGLAFWFNETSPFVAFTHKTNVANSTIAHNWMTGILAGNFCRVDSSSFWNISMNTFSENRDDAVTIHTCWKMKNTRRNDELIIDNNMFVRNLRLGIRIKPALYVDGLISYNQFVENSRGTLMISNADWQDLDHIPARFEVRHNTFLNNKGRFVVNVGLVQKSSVQQLLFTRNRLKDNEITEPYPGLNPRSRVAAVVTVSSSNALIFRNYLVNPKSKYELGVHLESHAEVINGSLNYWGEINDPKKIYQKIFDRKDRYNLALVEFLQFLKIDTDLDNVVFVSDLAASEKQMAFMRMSTGLKRYVGGEVFGEIDLEPGDYVVDKDIFVHPGSRLKLPPGVTLRFEKSVGMMVQGKLESSGEPQRQIVFTAASANNGGSASIDPRLRLSNGTEGRLEVDVNNGKWGSVCSHGWGIEAAAIACNQLGLVLNPSDWILEKSQFPQMNNMNDVVLSNVRCSDTDTNLLECTSERLNLDFEASCLSEVGLRCYPPSWSGIRLGMLAEQSTLRHVSIEKAGLLDYSTNAFKPALQIDFHQHNVEATTVQESTDSGLGIVWNNLFVASPKVTSCSFNRNRKHGVVTHSQRLEVTASKFFSNLESGLHYDPVVKFKEQQDLISWIVKTHKNNAVFYLQDIPPVAEYQMAEFGRPLFLIIPKASADREVVFKTNRGWSIGIIVINPVNDDATDDVTFYESSDQTKSSTYWSIRASPTAFPLFTPGYSVKMRYQAGASPRGGVILYLASIPAQGKLISSQKVQLVLDIHENEFIKCGRGISSNHYNWHNNVHQDQYHRYSNETILLTNNVITHSKEEAMYVLTPFWEPRQANLAEINYTLNGNRLSGNRQGIVQYSRDIRQSSNLYHWLLNDTRFDGNSGGGLHIRLLYVWQYSENQTHTVTVDNSTFQNNKNFEFVIDGHFAKVNITRNNFTNNHCEVGLVAVAGMEKQIFMTENRMEDNSGQFVMEFNIHSHAEKYGIVEASVVRNVLRGNKDSAERNMDHTIYQPMSYAISVKGSQSINISRNVFENPNMQFELLAGIYAGSLENVLNATMNYWSFTNSTHIRKRIFDFDDWNNYAIVHFNPILALPDVDGPEVHIPIDEQIVNTDQPFGGRLFSSQVLNRLNKPYVINSDLTVMPGFTLSIREGVEIEFYPSIGILVLGELRIYGSEGKPVRMRPVRQVNPKTTFRNSPTKTSVRLCVDRDCERWRQQNGFLEVFNATTLQWVPVCDPRFTERNAQVVCRELGFSVLNVHFQFGSRLDVGISDLRHVRFWPEPLECSGQEKRFSDCELRLNGFGNHSYECNGGKAEFVYIACGDDNEMTAGEEYWGGIRFAQHSFEQRVEGFYSTPHTYAPTPDSHLRHVDIRGAGILHGEKMAAIQIVRRDVSLENIVIKSCASHGIETIAPPAHLSYRNVEVTDNLGTGINIFVLGGSLNIDSGRLPYYPLSQGSLPYHIFGLVDVCDTNKILLVSERILLYYKYDNIPVDCVKILTSSLRVRSVGFRLLYFNLFNSTDYSAQPDFIRVFDGDVFSNTAKLIGEIGITEAMRLEQPELRFYRSRGHTLSIQLHASGASGVHGFVAEVVTVPVSHYIGRGLQHNISYTELSRNVLGGIIYQSAGESAPALTIEHTRIVSNGRKLFGNFTTIDAAAVLDIQNTRDLMFSNNLLMQNQGGLYLRVAAQSTTSSVHALIVNNLFTENSNREAMLIKGRRSGYYQAVDIVRNYFARNDAVYRDNIVLSEISSNFSENLVVENRGRHQLSLMGFPQISASSQTCQSNWFFQNEANHEGDRSTVYAASAGQTFKHNYFVNIDNNFEILAGNRSLADNMGSKIFAEYNWWGFNHAAAVSGKIKDGFDYKELLNVTFLPFLENNYTVTDRNCSGGWTRIGDTCFLYVGGHLTHYEAKEFCEKDNASLPYLRVKEEQLMEYMQSQQIGFDRWRDGVWIQSIDVPLDQCAIFKNSRVEKYGCHNTLPFLCEKDPEIIVFGGRPWYRDPLTIASIGVGCIVFVFLVLCVAFSICKSRQRYREKLERRNSIRASLRSLQSAGGSYGELGYRRRLEKMGDAIKPTVIKVNSVDSISKTHISSTSSINDEDAHSFDFSESKTHSADFVALTDRFGHDPRLENENANAMVRPTFDLTYENHGFREHLTPQQEGWSTASNSTLDIKRSLERPHVDARHDTSTTFRPTPSPPSEYHQEPPVIADYKSRTSTFRDNGGNVVYSNVPSRHSSTGSNTDRKPLETAM